VTDPAARRGLRLLATVVLATCGIGMSLVTGTASASPKSSTGVQRLVLYSVPVSDQYVNNEDDRARGQGNNPFGNYRGVGLATEKEHVGPLPGDEGLWAYHLYTSTSLKKRAGTAILVCQYNFAKNGFCDVSFQLTGGTIVGVGDFSALATKTFALAITGGTGIYRSATGTVEASSDNVVPTLAEIQNLSHVVPVLVLESQRLAFAVQLPKPRAGNAPSGLRQFAVYSAATLEQFIDNGDDEARGWAHNPFGLVDRSVQFAESEDKGGPYPGDAAYFSFGLYSAANLKTSVGSANFTCFYYFDKNAYCNGSYQLSGGTVLAGGAFLFDAKTFTLAVTGGTGSYIMMKGDIAASPSTVQSQLLTFALQPT